MNILLRFYPGDHVAVMLASILVQVTGVILLAAVVSRTVARHSAAARHCVWLCALGCAFLSPLMAYITQRTGLMLVSVPVLAAEIKPIAEWQPAFGPSQATDHPELTTEMEALQHAQIIPQEPPPAFSQPPDQPEASLLSTADLLRALGSGLLTVWLVGVIVFFGRLIYGCGVLAALRRGVEAVDIQQFANVLTNVRDALGVDTLPLIATSPALTSPIAAGVFRPLVIMPEELVQTLGSERLRDVLVHECAHVVRRDHLVGLVQRLAEMVFWPHPLVHYLNRQLARAREEVCDNYVLQRASGSSYARTLLELSEQLKPTLAAPATFGLLQPKWRLEERVKGLLDGRRQLVTRLKSPLITAVAVAFAAMLILIAGTRLVKSEAKANSINGANATPEVTLPETGSPEPPGNPAPKQAETEKKKDANGGSLPVSGTTVSGDALDEIHRGLWQERRSFEGHVDWIRSVAFSPDCKLLATMSGRVVGGRLFGEVKLWEAATGKERITISVDTGYVSSSVIFSPNGKTLAWGCSDGTMTLFDVASEKVALSFQAHQASHNVEAVAFAPDGETLATGGVGLVKLWDVKSGKLQAEFPKKVKSSVISLAFAPDGKTLASGGWIDVNGVADPGVVILWDFPSGKQRAMLEGAFLRAVGSLEFTSDSTQLAVGPWGGPVRLWDVRTLKERTALIRSAPEYDFPIRIALSRDSKTLAEVGGDATIRLWDVATGEERAVLKGHKGAVTCVAFASDGRSLVSGGHDETVKVWELAPSSENKK